MKVLFSNGVKMYESASRAYEEAKKDYINNEVDFMGRTYDEAIKNVNNFGALHTKSKNGNDFYAFCFNFENHLINWVEGEQAKEIFEDFEKIDLFDVESYASNVNKW